MCTADMVHQPTETVKRLCCKVFGVLRNLECCDSSQLWSRARTKPDLDVRGRSARECPGELPPLLRALHHIQDLSSRELQRKATTSRSTRKFSRTAR